ncbi:MAG: dUTP diphosphatase [Candidatus Moraniibacteriota bacterium]
MKATDAFLEKMLDAQERLQIESYGGVSPRSLKGQARTDFITWNILALTDELHEALAEVGWKPWATSRHVNEAAFKGELVDAFHFFMNLMLAANMDAYDLYFRYVEKRNRNAQRQRDGYDGVSGKCPTCKRALDDSKTSAAFHPYCSKECAR